MSHQHLHASQKLETLAVNNRPVLVRPSYESFVVRRDASPRSLKTYNRCSREHVDSAPSKRHQNVNAVSAFPRPWCRYKRRRNLPLLSRVSSGNPFEPLTFIEEISKLKKVYANVKHYELIGPPSLLWPSSDHCRTKNQGFEITCSRKGFLRRCSNLACQALSLSLKFLTLGLPPETTANILLKNELIIRIMP
ncbi:hypothetical protein EVAR_77255_1 [Eumeta japonica]|uniref:Uncharacterized protein n=1 Tax=Eumeta variegata TaxID=151549 RepID=A0A4C1ULB4_EUMVA|nr:hypothetical protein EVAR_77255_1 [Eumeta japonica]